MEPLINRLEFEVKASLKNIFATNESIEIESDRNLTPGQQLELDNGNISVDLDAEQEFQVNFGFFCFSNMNLYMRSQDTVKIMNSNNKIVEIQQDFGKIRKLRNIPVPPKIEKSLIKDIQLQDLPTEKTKDYRLMQQRLEEAPETARRSPSDEIQSSTYRERRIDSNHSIDHHEGSGRSRLKNSFSRSNLKSRVGMHMRTSSMGDSKFMQSNASYSIAKNNFSTNMMKSSISHIEDYDGSDNYSKRYVRKQIVDKELKKLDSKIKNVLERAKQRVKERRGNLSKNRKKSCNERKSTKYSIRIDTCSSALKHESRCHRVTDVETQHNTNYSKKNKAEIVQLSQMELRKIAKAVKRNVSYLL